jgi:hypothetical protein
MADDERRVSPTRAGAGVRMAVSRGRRSRWRCRLAPWRCRPRRRTEMPRGVQLKLVYETQFRPRLAVQPFTRGRAGAAEAAEAVHCGGGGPSDRAAGPGLLGPVRHDVQHPGPACGRGGEYPAWNALGVVYLVTGSVEETDSGYGLRLALHDVVYGNGEGDPPVPAAGRLGPGFRMAVHAAADEVVRWATGEPGVGGDADRAVAPAVGRDLRAVGGGLGRREPAPRPHERADLLAGLVAGRAAPGVQRGGRIRAPSGGGAEPGHGRDPGDHGAGGAGADAGLFSGWAEAGLACGSAAGWRSTSTTSAGTAAFGG